MQYVILSKIKTLPLDPWKVVSTYYGEDRLPSALSDLTFHNNNSVIKEYVLIRQDPFDDLLPF